MARFMIKALAVAALVCLVVDLAASDSGAQYQQPQEQQQHLQEPYKETATATESADISSTTTPGSFKDKLKGFVSSVKDGAKDAYESVSETVSGAAHSIDEKRKEAVAGTKKLVNTAIDKIKTKYDSFKGDEKDEKNVSNTPVESSEEKIDQRAQVDDITKKL